jgi:glycosyltransferase involved in cell wall biosynthesis
VRIAIIAPSPIPFLVGGAEKLFAGLFYNLLKYTHHQVELMKIPVHDQKFWSLIDGYYRVSQLDLKHFDMVISTKYPVWLIAHPNHHVYMQHTCRGVYDLYHLSGRSESLERFKDVRPLKNLLSLLQENPTREILPPLFRDLLKLRDAELPGSYFEFPGPLTRAIVRFLDAIALNPRYIRSYSAISETVAKREGYFPKDVAVRVIHHPTSLEGLHSRSYEYIFTASRLEGLKRIDLLIKAFRETDLSIELRLAGTGGLEKHLKELTHSDNRIRFLGFITDIQLMEEYAGSLFVPFIPYNEDYGLITLEAMLSEKAVLTVRDSGGPSELVQDDVNGRIVAPTVEALSRAMVEMVENSQQTMEMGKKAKETVEHINWENFVRLVLSEVEGTPLKETKETYVYEPIPKSKDRKKILIPSTFPVYPALGGGQRRVFNIAKELSRDYDVVIISISPAPRFEVSEINYALREVKIPRSEKQKELFHDLEQKFGQPAEDVALVAGYRENPIFCEILQNELRNADMVICCHPYLYDAVRGKEVPHIYDAHNVEYDLKRYILGENEEAQPYLKEVHDIEKACAQEAKALFSVSTEDKLRLSELYEVEEDRITVVPNGVDLDIPLKYSLPDKERKKLKKRMRLKGPSAVFVGSYHKPNIDALNEVIALARIRSNILFFIIGSVCNYRIEGTPENVIMLGVLSETEKAVVLNMADLGLNPVAHGGGSNLKLLEYSAYRLPTITTPYGKRGYEFKPEHFLVGELSDFPDLMDKALSMDKKSLLAIAEGAFSFLKENYTWQAILKKSLPLLP